MIRLFLQHLFPSPGMAGFGSAGIRRQQVAGAILVVGGGGWENAQRGVESDEFGINISDFECEYTLEVNDKLPNNFGQSRARAMVDDFSRRVRMTGEMIGPVPYSIATACEFSNDTDLIGSGAGDFFFERLMDRQSRGGWRVFEMEFSSDPLITAT